MTLRDVNVPQVPGALIAPVWVSPQEAMRLTSFGRTKVYELISSGVLRSIVIGRRRLISFKSIQSLGSGAI